MVNNKKKISVDFDMQNYENLKHLKDCKISISAFVNCLVHTYFLSEQYSELVNGAISTTILEQLNNFQSGNKNIWEVNLESLIQLSSDLDTLRKLYRISHREENKI